MSTATLRVKTESPGLLRRALLADGAVSGATGLLLALAAGPLGDLLDLPTLLLRLTGVSLLPYAAALLYVATREAIDRSAVWVVIGLNLLWAVASIALLLTGWVEPSGLGYAFVIAQALVVAAFADLQYLGLRRSA